MVGLQSLTIDTDGDCCSESWFADIISPQLLIGAPVTSAEEIPLPKQLKNSQYDNQSRTRQEEDRIYCIQIETTKGVCDIIFRNSSNGYYGGWADYSWTILDRAEYKVITEDYST